MQVTELRGTPTDHMMGQLLRVEEHGQILSHCFNINLDTTQGFQGNSKTSEERALAVRLYWLEEEAHQYSEWENNGVDDSGNRYTMEHWTVHQCFVKSTSCWDSSHSTGLPNRCPTQ